MSDSVIDRPLLEVTAGRRRLILLALILGTTLASLDASFVPIGFPDMIDDLDTSTGTVVWVALGYLLAATGPMLFFARLGDRIGFAPLFRFGLVLYGAAMTASAFAPDVGSLIAIRVAQGAGMAIFLPATFALAAKVYPLSERGKAMGILASANSLGFILGPIFAGWLLDSYDWRALFSSRAPLAVAAVALGFWALSPRLEAGVEKSTRQLDLKGAALLSVALFGLLFALNRLPEEDNHLEPAVWLVLAVGLAVAWWFVRHERDIASPLVDVDLYRTNPDFSKASIAFLAMFASFPVYLFILPLLLIAGLEFRAWDAGLLLAVVAMITFVVSPYAGRLSDRFGAERLCTVGASLVLVGYVALLGIDSDAAALDLLPAMCLFGLGTGLFFSPNNRLMMSSVPASQAGMASGMIGTVRQTGYAFGFAVTASLFTVIQTLFEVRWTRRALDHLAPAEAHRLTRIFDEGGIWAPEVLVFVLHAGAVLSIGVLLVSVLYSLPRLVFTARRHLAAIGGAVVLTAIALGVQMAGAEIEVGEEPVAATGIEAEGPPAGAVAPFGMAERRPVEVPAFSPPVLESGREVYVFYCSDCHGLEARGVEGRGVDLVTSRFLAGLSDRELIEYLRVGRSATDPANRTGAAMPGMETMTTFTEENYRQVVAYLRELTSSQQTAASGAVADPATDPLPGRNAR